MSKVVHSKEFALQEMRKGIDIVAEAVGNTIGPKGTNVFLDDPTSPKFTNDGASIAHVIQLEDKLQNAGAWVARNACAQTNDDAGDGTTTTVVVLKATIDECLARPENKTQVMHSLLEAKDKAITLLKKSAKPITQKEVINVARISAENEALAQLVTEVVGKVGAKAVITIEDRKDGFESDYKIVQGYEAHVGFISPYFRNDPEKARAVYENIPVLCTAKKLSNIQDLKFFEQLAKEKVNRLVIVAEDMEESVKGMFVATQLAGSMSLLVIKAQGPLLEDIANSVGATLIGDATGVTFENFDVKKHLGLAQRVVCEEKRTVFTSNAKSAKLHAERLEAWAENNPNGLEQRKLRERAAKLKGGVAVIRIGAHTDAERNYLKDKAEDTVHSVQSALAEGVVEGGGISLYRLSESIKGNSVGEEILRRSLTAPLRQIVLNSGKDYAEVIKNLPDGQGYNAKTDKYEDFFKTGVLDPLKVERCVLENAITTAAHFITSHSAIVDYTEPKTN
jgi:chaperonin GroEL